MKNDIMLFGMQGSGKGTQGKLFAQKYGFKMFETGGELRKITESGSELGNKIKTIIDSGHLVDSNIIMEVVENFLNNTSPEDKIIFDGIPRNIEQQVLFDKVVEKHGRKPIGINIKLTKEEALKRLSIRFICVGIDTTNNPLISEEDCIRLGGTIKKRNDDSEESIKKRLELFEIETQPVIDYYIKENRMFEINGIQSVEDVEKDFKKEFGL